MERVTFDGRPIAHVATEGGVSRQTLSKWVHRFLLVDVKDFELQPPLFEDGDDL